VISRFPKGKNQHRWKERSAPDEQFPRPHTDPKSDHAVTRAMLGTGIALTTIPLALQLLNKDE
jgi:hypothetical protein